MSKHQYDDEDRLNGRLVVLTDEDGYVFADTGEVLSFDQVQRMGLDATLRSG